MNQEIITLTKVFRDLDLVSSHSLFEFDGQEVIPRSDRVKLIFYRMLLDRQSNFRLSGLLCKRGGDPLWIWEALDDPLEVPKEKLAMNMEKIFEEFPKGFVFIHNPTRCYRGNYKHSNDKMLTDFSENFSKDTKICIQQEDTNLPRGSWFLYSTEQLGKLIAMLYFRQKGYIVQEPRTYGKEGEDRPGVDDVVAWKSPVVNRLREDGFIEKGCYVGELACLRWLGKVSTSSRPSDRCITEDVLLTEVKSLESTAISKGISQLLRAEKMKVAKRLFICFPFINKDVEEVIAEIKSRIEEGPAVGGLLFDTKGFHIQDSETFPDENVGSEIHEYEQKLKRALLNNFYFDEIVRMITELKVDTKDRGFKEVKEEFCGRVEVDYILDKLDDLI